MRNNVFNTSIKLPYYCFIIGMNVMFADCTHTKKNILNISEHILVCNTLSHDYNLMTLIRNDNIFQLT